MEDTNPEGGEAADIPAGHTQRSTDRRSEGGGLFGYEGPERRSGRDRRQRSIS